MARMSRIRLLMAALWPTIVVFTRQTSTGIRNEVLTHDGARFGEADAAGSYVIDMAQPAKRSGRVVRHNPPDVAIAWDSPTWEDAASNARFVIERQLDYAVTAIRTSRIVTSDLSEYEVLILPEAFYEEYNDVLGEDGTNNLGVYKNYRFPGWMAFTARDCRRGDWRCRARAFAAR